MNKLLVVALVGLLLVSCVGFIYYNEKQSSSFKYNGEINYPAMIKLGLSPNENPRQPTDKDIFTGVVGNYNNISVALFESRSFEKMDYGKSFLWRIN